MENQLKRYLYSDEEVCWQSQPKKFSLMDNSTKGPLMLNWCVTSAVTLAFLIYYFAVLCNGTFSPVFVALVLCIAGTIMYWPVKKQRNLQGAKYYITNRRAIMVTRDASYFCIDLADMGNVQEVEDRGGEKCLVLGSGLEKTLRKGIDWRSPKCKLAAHTNGVWECTESLMFFRAEDVDGAVRALGSQVSAA